MPLVSAILPVRDRAAWIARAVESVLAQTHPDVELLVVDDGSVDATPAILDRFGSRVVRLRATGSGPFAARNLGLVHARGELIAFIDSDDAWRPEHLARLVPCFDRTAVGLAFADTVHVGGPVDALAPTGWTSFAITPPHRGRVAAQLAFANFVPTTTAVVRRALFATVGPFTVDPPLGADYAKWIEIAEHCELDFDAAPGADYTVHAEGISSDLGRSLRARLAHVSRLVPLDDPSSALRYRRVRFHLGLHLLIAWARGRAARVPDAPQAVWHAAAEAGPRALPWAAVFAYHHALARMRRRRRAV